MENYNIRKARIKDLEKIVALSYKSAILHQKLTPYYKVSKDLKEVLFRSLKKNIHSSNSCILLAEEDGKMIGYLLAFKIDRLEMFEVKEVGFIADIFIEEGKRRMGVGEKLLKKCYNWFKEKNINFVEINVQILNKEAISFWNKKGFKDFSIQKYKKI
ncbi:MAG: GNAT family N-acetyltransferase [Candidatus Pacebacteria bacterium]|nr:GNAT family N-acetyltransferase [Candidatus Paceibacterota bacterium]